MKTQIGSGGLLTLRRVATLLVLVAIAGPAFPAPVTWDGSLGLLPWDAAVPANRRYTVQFPGPADTTTVVTGCVLQIRDNSAGSSVDASRLLTLTSADDWVVQTSIRIIDHARPGLDFGPSFAIQDTTHQAFVAIARDKVGILTFGGANWVDGATYAMNTTDAFHVYRLIKAGQNCYIDICRRFIPTWWCRSSCQWSVRTI